MAAKKILTEHQAVKLVRESTVETLKELSASLGETIEHWDEEQQNREVTAKS